MRQARVLRIPTSAPDDTSGLEAAIADGRVQPGAIKAILGKTEGNGCVNDFTRAFSVTALKACLKSHLSPEAIDRIAYVMSGGTEGGLSPHILVFESREESPPEPGIADSGALAIGSALTADMPAEHLGTLEQVKLVAASVSAAMADADITSPDDVHFVQIKCPLLTAERIAEADTRGAPVAIRDTLKSMGYSRGASALGVALALGEIRDDTLSDTIICRDPSFWSARASTSAGVELLNHEILVIGMSDKWTGPLAVDHAVMADGIDIEPVREALQRLGLPTDGQLKPAQRRQLVALLAKAEPGTTGKLRGARHTMLDDSDISATRHARAFVAGALGALVGTSEIFVSGGGEHQGPDGGGPVALIVDRSEGKNT